MLVDLDADEVDTQFRRRQRGASKTEITLDALNLINLFDRSSGLIQYLSFGQSTLIQPVPTTVTAAAPVTGYNITPLTAVGFQRWLRDDLRSRWQIQLGARIRF